MIIDIHLKRGEGLIPRSKTPFDAISNLIRDLKDLKFSPVKVQFTLDDDAYIGYFQVNVIGYHSKYGRCENTCKITDLNMMSEARHEIVRAFKQALINPPYDGQKGYEK